MVVVHRAELLLRNVYDSHHDADSDDDAYDDVYDEYEYDDDDDDILVVVQRAGTLLGIIDFVGQGNGDSGFDDEDDDDYN